MKKLSKLIVLILCFTLFSTAVGCGNSDRGDPNSADTLDVYVYNSGYGYKWCVDALEAFKQEDWVKEKYPNLKVNFTKNEIENYGSTQLSAGKGANVYDLIFAPTLFSYFGPTGPLLELSEVLYDSMVPGEDIKFKDKMLSSYVASNAYNDIDATDEPQYYSVSYASGMTGIVYNENVLNSLGFEVPRTTNELLAILNAVRALKDNKQGKYANGYSFLTYGASAYVNYLVDIWWAQYEGADEYVNFFSGIDSDTNSISPEIFKRQGRLETLKVIEEIYLYDKGNVWINPNSGRSAYLETQTSLLRGKGIFMANGDWFDNEMAETRKDLIKATGKADTIKMMKTPIISSIINKTPTIKDDATLSAVVKAIDEGKTSYEGVSEDDFATIQNARMVVYSIGPNHTSVIPSYAAGKEIAVDFLRFLATDKANEIYVRATGGATLPFKYDLRTKNEELYNSISPFQQEIISYFNNPSQEVNILPSTSSFPLVRFGTLKAFASLGNTVGYYFTSNSSKGDYETLAEKIFYTDYDYWTENNNARWNNCKSSAGI
ncbi:MAG TPA: ABC transporter substrate-binding protein [Clostridia bacterium]